MRKLVVGTSSFVAGILLTLSVTAYGAELNMIGKKVQGETTFAVEGKSQKAIIIDGTSYAPLKVVGESVGYDVTYQNKQVVFSKKGGVVLSEAEEKIKQIRKQLSDLDKEGFELISSDSAKLGDPGNDEFLKKGEEIKQKREELQAQLDDLLKQQ